MEGNLTYYAKNKKRRFFWLLGALNILGAVVHLFQGDWITGMIMFMLGVPLIIMGEYYNLKPFLVINDQGFTLRVSPFAQSISVSWPQISGVPWDSSEGFCLETNDGRFVEIHYNMLPEDKHREIHDTILNQWQAVPA